METKYNIKADCRGMLESDIFDKIMQQRGIEDVEHFLNPTEDDLLPLANLPHVKNAYNTVFFHIENGNKITVLFDTDLDGITAGTIMTRYLRNFGVECQTVINEGKAHGLLGQDLSRFEDTQLLIVVDSLDANAENYAKLKEQGMDIIVLDHHTVNPDVPYDDYVTLVTSQVNYDNPALSGAGTVWKFCKYIDEQELTDYADELVDLAACGLVGDMMDITSMENRYIVSKGLEKINNLALKKIIGGYEFNSTAIAFSVAPLVNASNRMNKNEYAMKSFLSDDNKEVLSYMKVLKQCKEDQNTMVAELMPSITEQCEKQLDKKMISVFIESDYGIAGLIGNKILEKYQRPLLILKDCDDTYSGSMRAVGLSDFRQMCEDSGLAEAKGHELASGITVKKSDFEKFCDYIEKELSQVDFKVEVDVDIKINVSDITRSLVDKIKSIDRISGTGFKPIKCLVEGMTEYEVGQMSDYKHLVLKPNDYTQFIKWNFNGSFEDFEDYSMMNEEVQVIGNLDSGFFGRKFVLKVICDEINVA